MNTKQVNPIIENAISQEIEFLKSNENLNKNGDRVLVRLEDLRFKTFVRSIKNYANLLEDKNQIESFVYESTKNYIEALRINELLVERKSSKSQTRHAIDTEFNKFKRNLVKLGLAFEHPLHPNKIVFEELSFGSGEEKSKELKPSYKELSLNCSFESFVDKVEKIEKIVKS